MGPLQVEGQGRKQRKVSMASQDAVSGARTPGCRSGTLGKPASPVDEDCSIVGLLEQPANGRSERSAVEAKRAVFIVWGSPRYRDRPRATTGAPLPGAQRAPRGRGWSGP